MMTSTSADARFAAKLREIGLQSPPMPVPKGAYKVLKTVGSMVYVSGHVPVTAAGEFVTGKVGADLRFEIVQTFGGTYHD